MGVVAAGVKGWMMTFISETRKEKKTGLGGGGGGEGWEKKAAAAVKRKGEEKCFAWLQSKRGGGRHVFSLTPGSSSDRRLCVSLRARVLTCVRALLRGSSVNVSRGRGRMWEKAPVAREKQSAVPKQHELCDTTQRNKVKRNCEAR